MSDSNNDKSYKLEYNLGFGEMKEANMSSNEVENRYPEETLDPEEDNGTMPSNVDALTEAVIGRRIVSAEKQNFSDDGHWSWGESLVLTLDDGRRVILTDTYDCCACTYLESFLLHPESVDHVILGVGTTDGYTTWHIFADFGDVMTLDVRWSCGNPFFYVYGFNILVENLPDDEGNEP